ncbi:hypothetical protein OM076_42340, partial [Solirubrobacter ginsenosidimutans]
DPLADFVLRSELTPGATVMVEPAPEGSDEAISLTIVTPPVPKPAPVGVGGRKEGDDGESVDDTGALDTPPVEPSDEA